MANINNNLFPQWWEKMLKERGISPTKATAVYNKKQVEDKVELESSLQNIIGYESINDNTNVSLLPEGYVSSVHEKKTMKGPQGQTYLNSDTRSDYQRTEAKQWFDNTMAPDIIGETMRKPLRWLADPMEAGGDVLSMLGIDTGVGTGNDEIATKKMLYNPHINTAQRYGNLMTEGSSLSSSAILNWAPYEVFLPKATQKMLGMNWMDDVLDYSKNPYVSPKNAPIASSVDDAGKGFKSEINWGNFNSEIPKENSNPYGYMRRIFNPPVDELGQKLKFSVPSKIKNSETYRVMTTADTEHLLSTGKFKTSLPIEQDVKFMEGLKTTNPERYKAIKYAENSRNYTRVTPDKNYAEMHYFDDLINPSDKGNIITLKPLKNRIAPSTEVGGYNELFAKDLTIDDVLHIKDRSGKVIYQSPNSKNSFKSEIDWGKWNKEIPENKKLIQEYNLIEQQAKANGTWMKNPDGSIFQGTPEQFIQQNSQNFKHAFGNSKLVNPDGSAMNLYHGSDNKFNMFDESLFGKTDKGMSGEGIYTSPVKDYAERVSNKNMYELYGNAQNPVYSSNLIEQKKPWTEEIEALYNFNRKNADIPNEQKLLDYDSAITDEWIDLPGKQSMQNAYEIVFKKNTQLKSATGNNGMFDMTNPNIYKSIVPVAGGGAAAVYTNNK